MGLRALEVEVLDSSGKHLATHPRAYGQASTNSEDPSMQLALLCNKPASWPNSRVRDALPDPLREWLDRQDRQTRNEALQTLKRVFCQVGVGRFGVSFSPCERRVSGRFGVGRSCWLLVIALVIA